MNSQFPNRERAVSSDRAEAAPVPQRPGLLNRTISAPAGGLYKLDPARVTYSSVKPDRTLMEEDELSPTAGRNKSLSAAPGDEPAPKPNFPHVSIAVVGPDHVGKSTFIESALDMKHSLASRTTTKKMSLDGTVYLVRLLEIDTLEISIGSNGEVQWPRLGGDTPPSVDGVLVLHDVTQPGSLSTIKELLASLDASSIPFRLVASKCDIQPPNSPIEPVLDGYEILRTSPDSPRSQKMCIALVLRSVISDRNGKTVTPGWRHSRANSENPTTVFSGAAGGPIAGALDSGIDGYGIDRQLTDSPTSNGQGPRYARSNSHPLRPHTPPSGRLNQRKPSIAGESSPGKDFNRQHRLHAAWRNSGGSDAFSSFIEMGEEMDGPRSIPSSPGSKDKTPSESSSHENGFTFDELVDRLVAQPMSKHDSKFASIFLCLYRKFAAPSSLLTALINRFERNEREISDQLTRIADQLRLLTVLAQWVSEYPGDLAYPKTQRLITEFVANLEKSHFYMFAAKEISSYLEASTEDDNIGWPFRDGEVPEMDATEPALQYSGRSSPSIFLGPPPLSDEGDEEEEDPIYSMSALDLSEGALESGSRLSASMSNSFTAEKPGTVASQSFTALNIDSAQKEARLLDLTPRVPLTKVQWRQFMEIPDEDFARELTRIDWIMFNSFRPRDLVRHVSITGADKDKIQSLKHVNRMIKQFNHVAFFVASVILLRDKPKHRAKALEKFMNIAFKLRRLNNYNSLGALIAGINGTPVHRLSQTRELVPMQTQKDFMRLVILMGTQKSHFAYRLAWDNSFAERIPFLPLHRRDLVSAEEGNRTFVGDTKTRINWRKFEVMGEVVLGIQRSQKTPYPHLAKFDEVTRLILDIKLSGDEEDLYARSMQVEPSAGGEPGRKKFGWLRRRRRRLTRHECNDRRLMIERATRQAFAQTIPPSTSTSCLRKQSPRATQLPSRQTTNINNRTSSQNTTHHNHPPTQKPATPTLKMSTPVIPSIKTTYRAILRELPRRTLNKSTPLHASVRALYKNPASESSASSSNDSESEIILHSRLQEAEQFAQYARAQRQYAALIERYNPGSWLDEEERIRLTARRVGLDLPVEGEGKAN
ncbi:putative Ras guanyl-nucleotide exchange factor RasGEF [Aspergillus saccharolyticus JOP 1030-1]|uniref:Ras GEF n=1 Tax=Aspergillus saccharolyticus JOP 1030-1 TaxID=1450539 RepID=A0A318ZA63_9EURO|nr:ras GEF [Aspergillus saccharolyticus JOP 1030-1]PYH44321.1 ras GEF [Aspergillus saccharolyticus JOP 1030-1]